MSQNTCFHATHVKKIESSSHKPFGLLKPLQPSKEKSSRAIMEFIKPLARSKENTLGLL